jgi:hypothetical protein
LSVRVAITNTVQQRKSGMWQSIHEGSAADCTRILDLVQRHFPQQTYRVVTLAEAAADRRKKTWSVHDSDHVPTGSRVLLARPPGEIHPSIGEMHRAFGMPTESEHTRYGVVTTRHRRYGSYVVQLDGPDGRTLSISVERGDLIYPIPDNVVALVPRSARSPK